jgi:hypothetical protein
MMDKAIIEETLEFPPEERLLLSHLGKDIENKPHSQKQARRKMK